MREYYEYVFTDLADSRTNNWLLMNDPIPTLMILVAYLYFSMSWGPQYMKDRKPYKLQTALIVYNVIQVIISIYLFRESWNMWITQYNWSCEPIDTSHSDGAIRIARAVHLFFLVKLTDLLDTVFFVLRKKDNQVTTLHLYHHTIMPIVSWLGARYAPGGHGTLIGFINSFVHIIMYSYYLIAALGPHYQKYLWWKKYITMLQLVQFVIVFMHALQVFWQDCAYPHWPVYLLLTNTVIFFYLFSDFYKKAYLKPNYKANTTKHQHQL